MLRMDSCSSLFDPARPCMDNHHHPPQQQMDLCFYYYSFFLSSFLNMHSYINTPETVCCLRMLVPFWFFEKAIYKLPVDKREKIVPFVLFSSLFFSGEMDLRSGVCVGGGISTRNENRKIYKRKKKK